MAGRFIPLNDAEKELLRDRYSDLKFEQDVGDFVCVHCNRLAIVHFFTNCGHLLCLNCKTLIDNGGIKCQKCNRLITNASEHRDYFERQLLALKTKCPNSKYGCQITTILAEIPEHVRMCKFTREHALPALSSEKSIVHKILEKVNEQNENMVELKSGIIKLNEYNVASEKYKEDLKMELRGLRSDINIEIKERKEDRIQLKKEISGEIQLSIETNLKKLIADEFRAMKEHMKNINFENLTIKEETANINDKAKDMEQPEVELRDKRLSNIPRPNTRQSIKEILKPELSAQQMVDIFLFGSADEQMVFESHCLKWTIEQKDKLIPTQGRREHRSDIFPTYGFQFKAQLRLISSGATIGLELCFKDEEKNGQKVDIKPLPIVTFIVKDLSGQNKPFVRYKYQSFKSSLKYTQFGYGIGLITSQWNAVISPDDESLEVLVLVEPPTISNNPCSVSGIMTHTIEHYSRKLQMAKEGLIEGHWSPSFLTHADGYRVAVQMWFNEPIGYKRGLEAEINFLAGEFDSQLGIEFEHETSVMLINKMDAEENITIQKQAKTVKAYRIEIASGDIIGSGGFLVNDSLTYQVTIKPIPKNRIRK